MAHAGLRVPPVPSLLSDEIWNPTDKFFRFFILGSIKAGSREKALRVLSSIKRLDSSAGYSGWILRDREEGVVGLPGTHQLVRRQGIRCWEGLIVGFGTGTFQSFLPFPLSYLKEG